MKRMLSPSPLWFHFNSCFIKGHHSQFMLMSVTERSLRSLHHHQHLHLHAHLQVTGDSINPRADTKYIPSHPCDCIDKAWVNNSLAGSIHDVINGISIRQDYETINGPMKVFTSRFVERAQAWNTNLQEIACLRITRQKNVSLTWVVSTLKVVRQPQQLALLLRLVRMCVTVRQVNWPPQSWQVNDETSMHFTRLDCSHGFFENINKRIHSVVYLREITSPGSR